MGDNRRRNITVLGVCSLILVAMVVALTIGSQNNDENQRQDVQSSTKAIQTICQPTSYQEACVDSLKSSSAGNTSDPKQLMEAAFEAAIKYVEEAIQNSSLLQKLYSDPQTKMALDNCQELAGRAINDLQRSLDKFRTFDISNFDNLLDDLKIWLSGAMTYQETCIDGFEGLPGDAGAKMREILKTSSQLTSNGLAMVTEISSVLTSLNVQRRRLLEEGSQVAGHGDDLLDWLDIDRRNLLGVTPNAIKPDLIVAKDGSGRFSTINEALSSIPQKQNKTFVLYIKEGIYEEKVQFNSTMTNLLVIGDGPTKTRITGKLSVKDGVTTYHTATVAVLGDYFIAKDIGFENTAGPEKHQAVALRVGADKSIFYNCRMDGYQDTLYAHTYRQYYRDCEISGTIDFIFGDSASMFQNCTFVIRKPMDNQQNIVTAQGRKEARQPTGIVLQNCSIIADPLYYPVKDRLKSYLARPWKEYSRTIIMESFISDAIQPEGYVPWDGNFGLKTLFYAEFNNRGPGSAKQLRVKWPGLKELPAARVQRFTAMSFIDADTWLPSSGVPYVSGFIYPLPKEEPAVKYSPVDPNENKDLVKSKDKSAYMSRPDASSSVSSSTLIIASAPTPAPSSAPVIASAPTLPSASAPATAAFRKSSPTPSPVPSRAFGPPAAVPSSQASAPAAAPVSAPSSAIAAAPASAPSEAKTPEKASAWSFKLFP